MGGREQLPVGRQVRIEKEVQFESVADMVGQGAHAPGDIIGQ